MTGIIGPPYPTLPYMLYEVLKKLCQKRKSGKERESLEEKIKTIKELHDDGLISETQCQEAIEKILEAYSTESA